MGRWVRWFGSEEGTPGAPASVGRAHAPRRASGRVMTVSSAQARKVAQMGNVGMAPAPTGQISVETLPAEMLTAILVDEGALSRENEHICLVDHRSTGRPVEDTICESGFVAESDLMSILSRRCKVPHLSLERYQIRDKVLNSVPAEFARANRVMPLERLGKVLNVATSNPLNMVVFKKLEEETGLKVKPVLATPRELRECIDKHFPPPEPEEAPEPQGEDVRFTARDILKESWLGDIDRADQPEEQAAPESEVPAAEAGPGEPDAPSEDSRPVPLSEDEAGAFVKTSNAELFNAWLASVGAAEEGSGVSSTMAHMPALPVSEAEFAVLASDRPAPPAPKPEEETPTRASKKKSVRKKSRKKRKKKRKPRR